MWLAFVLGLLRVDDLDATRRLDVPLGSTVEIEVGYAVGFRCDNVEIIEPEMKRKSDKMNVFVVKGLALGHTQCRVGLAAQGPTTLFDVQVVPKPSKR